MFDTLLDEQSILGLALGAGLAGLLPVPEIQYLAYLHNAADQIRGEAATLSFFSQGQYRNPLLLRLASLAYQEGFGGHFHNDNALASLRDIPGLIVACPARPDDAAAMLRTCLAAAEADARVCVFLEPIALYHTRDLHQAGDGGWLAPYDPPGCRRRLRPGGAAPAATERARPHHRHVRQRAADEPAGRGPAGRRGIGCRVLDLRWIAPLPAEDILREATVTGRVLVADETRRTGGVSEAVITTLVDAGFTGRSPALTAKTASSPWGTPRRRSCCPRRPSNPGHDHCCPDNHAVRPCLCCSRRGFFGNTHGNFSLSGRGPPVGLGPRPELADVARLAGRKS